MANRAGGFSLLELLITVAIIGIVSAVALPAYRTYIETANMSKVNAAYENAIRVIQQEYGKDTTRVSLGLTSTFPTTSNQWRSLLNPDDQISAPGGGPMYSYFDPASGGMAGAMAALSGSTGTILIVPSGDRSQINVIRPAYLKLKPRFANIRRDSINVVEL